MADPIIPPGAFAAMKAASGPKAPVAPKAPAPTPTPAPSAPKPVEGKVVEPSASFVEKDKPVEPPKEMTAAEKKIWKLKADGEEFEYDATDEERVKRDLMKIRGADKRFEQAAAKTKQAEEFIQMLKKPETLRKVLEDPSIGLDVKKFAEDFIWEQIQESQLTPEQKAQRDKDRELERYRNMEQTQKEAAEQQRARERQAQFETTYEQKITKALEMGGIPKTQAAVSRMADYMLRSVEHNIDVSPEELVQHVRNDYLQDINSIFGDADVDLLIQMLGESRLEKLRQADLKKLRSTHSTPFASRARNSIPEEKKTIRKMSASEWKDTVSKSFLARNK